jgi:hypothetical protein
VPDWVASFVSQPIAIFQECLGVTRKLITKRYF